MAKILSIELGHSVIKLCEMDYKVSNPKIYQCQEAITPPGAVNDGYIADGKMKDLAYAIKETIARNGIKTKKVVFTVASAKIINREVVVPDVKENQIGSVVQANLADYFPVSLADYEVTHSLVQTIPDGPDQGKHCRRTVSTACRGRRGRGIRCHTGGARRKNHPHCIDNGETDRGPGKCD